MYYGRSKGVTLRRLNRKWRVNVQTNINTALFFFQVLDQKHQIKQVKVTEKYFSTSISIKKGTSNKCPGKMTLQKYGLAIK